MIKIRAPYGTDLHALKAEIIYQGKTISPPADTAQDFRHPVTYHVEGETSSRTFTVEIQPDHAPDIFPTAGHGVPGIPLFAKLVIPHGGGIIRLTAPPGFEKSGKKYPLHLHFHGAGGDSAGSESKFPFNKAAGTPGYEYFLATWESGKVNLVTMLDYLSKNYPIDTQHIWLSGHSTGAWLISEEACTVPTDRYNIELSIVIGSPYVLGCPEGKNHIIISGSYDFVPFFGYFTNRRLFERYKADLQCRKEALKNMFFDDYPYQVSRYAAFDCKDNREVHLYVLRGDMHNPHLGRNFISNLMKDAFRMSNPISVTPPRWRPFFHVAY